MNSNTGSLINATIIPLRLYSYIYKLEKIYTYKGTSEDEYIRYVGKTGDLF